MNTVRKRAGDPATDAAADAKIALKKLIQSDPDPKERKTLLANLGYGRTEKNKKRQRDTTTLHESLAMKFNGYINTITSNDTVLTELLEAKDAKANTLRLQDLLVPGTEGQTILHVILDPSTYSGNFDFDRLKPFIRFLLRLQPELPAITDIYRRTPLFAVLSSTEADPDQQDLALDGQSKERIVRYFCDERSEENPNGLGSQSATESLIVMASSSDSMTSRHALHVAIENDVFISEKVVKSLSGLPAKTGGRPEKKLCLEMPDGNGKTCLHIALTGPFTGAKISWAKLLVKLQPGLLKSTCESGSGQDETGTTPLQHFTEQRNIEKQDSKKGDTARWSRNAESPTLKLNGLEEFLKHQCLKAFDNSTCKSIMYTRKNVQEIYFTLEEGDVISGESLKRLSQHYKLDTTLRSVHIPRIRVRWDDDSISARKIARTWDCVGSTDLYMIFHWLKEPSQVGVKKVLEVVVDDFEDGERKPHSDKVIVESLKGLQVETWDWRRMDISSDVIFDAAGEHVNTLYLYCSGLRAVLKSWSDRSGLAKLKKLEKVYLETHQGLESIETMTKYVEKFESDIKNTFMDVNGRSLTEVRCDPVKATQKKTFRDESSASKLKDENEQGFEEQDWLKCMDEFADIVELMDTGGAASVKVALVDDGVKSSYAGLDDNIDRGKSYTQQPKSTQKKATRGFSRNYNTSHLGHGTVMAYYVRRVCPRVRLYVAKLDPELQRFDVTSRNQITFSIESAVEAIKWAVEENVDVICMSWAIDEKASDYKTKRVNALRDAIKLAADNNILLFCANPDKGLGHQNNTYPKQLDANRVFCIGAATQDGNRWREIDPTDTSCDYFLPGVELGIQVETNKSSSKKNVDEPPSSWRTYSGSSLSCALAAGLAAMILYCTQVSGVSATDPKWKWLKSDGGMRNALDSIHVTPNKWLPVRRMFGQSAFLGATNEVKKQLLREEVVAKFFARMPHGATEPEAAPGELRKQGTIKEGQSLR